jgi:hypothetical protein
MGAGPYGRSDGSSWADAWHLDDSRADIGAVDWRQVRPGDTLHVCGLHDGGAGDRGLRPTVSGTAGAVVVIDGACPRTPGAECSGSAADSASCDRGEVFAAGITIRDGWTALPGTTGTDGIAVYTQADVGCTSTQLIEDRTLRLNRIAPLARDSRQPALPFAAWPAGSFFQPDVLCELPAGDPDRRRVWYKPAAGIAGAVPVYTTSSYPAIDIRDVDHVVVRNLAIRNVSTAAGMIGIENAQHVRIENNDLRWSGGLAVAVRRDADFGRITGNRIYQSAQGITFGVGDDSANNADYWIIAGNEVYDLDQECYYCNDDNEGIGIQGGTGNVIEFNHLHHIGGSGIVIYTFVGQVLKDTVVRYNFIHDIEDLGGQRNARGFDRGSSSEDSPVAVSGNRFEYNVIARVANEGIRIKEAPAESGYMWSIFNNVVYDVGVSFAWSEYTAGDVAFRASNNIFANPRRRHIDQQAYRESDSHAGILMESNIYYPDGSPGRPLFTWANVAYESLQSWQAASGIGGGSVIANPRFVDPVHGDFHWAGSERLIPGAGDFRLQSESPAINAAAHSVAPRDINGQAVTDGPDIGAYEAAGSGQVAGAGGGGGAMSPQALGLILGAIALRRISRRRGGGRSGLASGRRLRAGRPRGNGVRSGRHHANDDGGHEQQ